MFDDWTDEMLAEALREAEQRVKRNTSPRGAQSARLDRSEIAREINRRAATRKA